MNPYSEFPDRVNVCIDIIDTLSGKKDYLYKDPNYTIEDQVWEIAKEYDSMPDFNNIYYGIVFNELENLVIEKYPELDFEFFHDVNGYASGTAFNTPPDNTDWFEIADEEDFFDTIAKLKFDKLDDCFENRIANSAVQSLLEAVDDKESIIVNFNSDSVIQVSKFREAFEVGGEIYDNISIAYKDETLELLVKPKIDKNDDFEYKIVGINDLEVIDTTKPHIGLKGDDINLSVKDEVLQKATEFMDTINKEHSLLLNDTSAMESLRKENVGVIYDSFIALDDDNAEFVKNLINSAKTEFVVRNEDYSRASMFVISEKENDRFSLTIVSNMKVGKDLNTTYGGDEFKFDFVVHNDKVLPLNVEYPDEPFKSYQTFDDKGIANIVEQGEATKDLIRTLENLQEKYQIREKLESHISNLKSETHGDKDDDKSNTRKQR